MTGEQFLEAITALRMTQEGSARFLGVNHKTPQRWISEKHPIPHAVSMLLRVMLQHNLTPHYVLSLEEGVAHH